MIFRPELCNLILHGHKTVTRRLVKTYADKHGIRPCKYVVGRTYALQPGRGKKGVGRILITSVMRQRLTQIDDADAILEGFIDRDDFRDYWRNLYGPGEFARDPLVWRIEFAVLTSQGYQIKPKHPIPTEQWEALRGT